MFEHVVGGSALGVVRGDLSVPSYLIPELLSRVPRGLWITGDENMKVQGRAALSLRGADPPEALSWSLVVVVAERAAVQFVEPSTEDLVR